MLTVAKHARLPVHAG